MKIDQDIARDAIRKVCGFFGGNATELARKLRMHSSQIIGRRAGSRNFSNETAMFYATLVIYAAMNDQLREIVSELPVDTPGLQKLNKLIEFPECVELLVDQAVKLLAGEVSFEDIQLTRYEEKSIIDSFIQNRNRTAFVSESGEESILIESKELPECPIAFIPVDLNVPPDSKP